MLALSASVQQALTVDKSPVLWQDRGVWHETENLGNFSPNSARSHTQWVTVITVRSIQRQW